MALCPLMTFKLVKELKKRPGARIAAMGYPDVIAPQKLIDELTSGCIERVRYRVDSEAICLRHGITDHRPIADAESLFGLFGATLDVFDVVAERGGEILCDLNYPLEDRHHAQYDFVLDVGTLEHCFNIGQAALNMAALLKAGGMIFHENPFQMGNHGFYGLNPTWYADFYGQPGFGLLDCRLLERNGKHALIEGQARVSRFLWSGGEVNCYAVAERREVLPITFPTQTKYRRAA